ncbi:MAG TPA: hypothetical protein VED41_13065 [Solirubrobacteraceae bacterium]|nr:hypothetical protein [Solirubrobacteraceae bacterium]
MGWDWDAYFVEQPLPRADWSGNPATFERPHQHIGGDLPPFHPWNDLSLEERARRWAAGERPDLHYSHEGALERMRRAEHGAERQLFAAADAVSRDWLGRHGVVVVEPGRDSSGNAAVVVHVNGDAGRVRAMIDAVDWRRYGWPGIEVRESGPVVPLVDCEARGDAFMRGDPRFERAGEDRVGLFFYDPDLAKLGNAASPFIPNISYDVAQRAMNLPLQDRYGSRLEAPTWADWMGMGGGERVGGAFDVVSERTGFKKGTLLAIGAVAAGKALLAHRNPEHALEIGAAGAACAVLSMALDVGAPR